MPQLIVRDSHREIKARAGHWVVKGSIAVPGLYLYSIPKLFPVGEAALYAHRRSLAESFTEDDRLDNGAPGDGQPFFLVHGGHGVFDQLPILTSVCLVVGAPRPSNEYDLITFGKLISEAAQLVRETT
jgi:hypothetical protein